VEKSDRGRIAIVTIGSVVLLLVALTIIGNHLPAQPAEVADKTDVPVAAPAAPAAPAVKPVAAPTPDPVELKPEMLVTFAPGAFACPTEDQLREALTHLYKHENTLMTQMFTGEITGCIVLPQDSKNPVRILSLEKSNDSWLSSNDMAQLGATDGTTGTIWANAEKLKPAP
jgi:hypothetical protein